MGPTRVFSEPSSATVVLIFYLFVFPLRGLAIVLGDYRYVGQIAGWLTPDDLATSPRPRAARR